MIVINDCLSASQLLLSPGSIHTLMIIDRVQLTVTDDTGTDAGADAELCPLRRAGMWLPWQVTILPSFILSMIVYQTVRESTFTM